MPETIEVSESDNWLRKFHSAIATRELNKQVILLINGKRYKIKVVELIEESTEIE